MTDERIKEERNKNAKIIVARLLGSLEATPLNISMIETVLVEYEIKITRAAERLAKIEELEYLRDKSEYKMNPEMNRFFSKRIAELKEEVE